MSWVLILSSDVIGRVPAVIGGYPTRDEAERAGDLATGFPEYDPEHNGNQTRPFYGQYMVIPGAAADGPIGATHSFVVRLDFDGLDWSQGTSAKGRPNELIRHTVRLPGEKT